MCKASLFMVIQFAQVEENGERNKTGLLQASIIVIIVSVGWGTKWPSSVYENTCANYMLGK